MRSDGSPVRRAAVVTHERPERTGAALERLKALAGKHGIELVEDGKADGADIVVVLGGDGTMLRALHRFLGTGIPVIGVNYGAIGFLTSIRPDDLERDLPRVFSGDYRVIELSTLEVEAGAERRTAVNDVVVASATLGRMVQLAWAVGGEDLGTQPCDGVICATPAGSTGYNLSNGGPVLVWGVDALAITFIAAHSLHARPLVVPRSREVTVRNDTADVAASVLADGRELARLGRGEQAAVRLGPERSLLATIPEATFFRRYRETFAS